MQTHAWKLTLGVMLCSPGLFNVSVSGQHQGKEVHIASVDGMNLRGVYYDASQTGPGVLLLHQCDREGIPTGYEKLAVMLSERGFHVLTLDFRGYGGSRNEKYTGENWQEAGTFFPGDTETAYQFLTAQPKVDKTRMALVGASCGGRQAVLLAARHREIQALVLLSGSIRNPLEEALAQIRDRPVFCVASDGDSTAARAMKQVFDGSQRKESRFLLYKGNDHGTPLFVHDLKLEGMIVEWFEAHLKK